MSNTFLSAEWRKLIMINYAVNPQLLEKYLPKHTELDLHQGVCYVSVVGFMFLDVKLKGIPIPFHRNFEEVNLRFYVKHKDAEGNYKRGVVFISEIVPKLALSIVANVVYNEPYVTMPMHHNWTTSNGELTVNYGWRKNKKWYSVEVVADVKSVEIKANSIEEFITEHYWGYNKSSDTKTMEYGVEHPRWQVYPVKKHAISMDFEHLYGSDFAFLNQSEPTSTLLAEGSEILVKDGKILRG
jgi:uncharacterized protein